MYFIYLTTNLINNKIYVGQHISNEENDLYFGSGNLIQRALKKYGKTNFKREILEWCETQDETDEREKYYIQLYNSQDPEIGYNISEGGYNGFFTGCTHSEDTKNQMSQSHTGKTFNSLHCQHISEGKKGHVYSKERDNKISAGLKARYAIEKPEPHFAGRKHSEESRVKMSQSHSGRKFSEETRKKMALAHSGKKYNKHK